eukprot:scpid107808/ scgid16817/ 
MVFNNAAPAYKEALSASGFPAVLTFDNGGHAKKRRDRKRNRTWYNLSFSKSVSTSIGQRILKLVRKHFPASSPLCKIFNKNTVKVSYSCMANMSCLIKGDNQTVLAPADGRTPAEECSCRAKPSCPLD